MVESKTKCIILPGNGCSKGTIRQSNWYGWAEDAIREAGLFDEVILRDMPDPIKARENIWLPFIKDELHADENTVVIGHSSGAEAAMRLLESQPLLGIVLVSACWTDLGDAGERAAGYYARPWDWDAMKKNVGAFGIN
jgi:predicted alpha/beta hydrolase family esterase